MANERDIEIVIEAKDYASSVFRSVTSGVRTFGNNTNNAMIRFNSSLRGYNNAMRGFNTAVIRTLSETGRAIYNFTEDAIKKFAELEQQHAKTMGAMKMSYDFSFGTAPQTPEQTQNKQKFYADSSALKQQAIALGTVGPDGQGSLYNPIEISQAQTALVKAGVDPREILSTDAIENVIKFAGGNDLSIGTATDFAVQLGTQFRIPMADWGGMLDQVTAAADMSIIDVEDIIESMKYAGNMASGFDQPLSDILAALAVMGNAGLKGSQAGTGVQAIFARGMSPTGISGVSPPPTENVENAYNAFKDRTTDENGKFVGLGNFTEDLSAVMGGLTDKELAWFTRKMFGMFQQKAALALGRTNEDGEVVFDEIADAIVTQAPGTIDSKWELMLGSMYGDIERLKNAYTGIQTDIGDRLSPAVKEVSGQFYGWMTDPNNYEFNMQALKDAIYASGDLIAEKYGDQIGQLVKDLGDFLVDGFQIGGATLPTLGGVAGFTFKFLSGDFDGAFQAFNEGLEATNTNIDGLPDDLKEMATNVRNVITALAILAGVNAGTNLLSGLLTIWNSTIGKILGKILNIGMAKITSARTTVTAANTTLNANYVQVNSGTASIQTGTSNATVATMNAHTATMTVYANVVNIIGGGGIGGQKLPTGGSPILGGGSSLVGVDGRPLVQTPVLTTPGGPLAVLPGATGPIANGASTVAGGVANGASAVAGNVAGMLTNGLTVGAGAVLGNAFTRQVIANGFPQLALTGNVGSMGAAAGSTGASAAGAAGAGVSGAGAVAPVLGTALKAAGLVGMIASMLTLSGDSASPDSKYADIYQSGVNKGLSGDKLREYIVKFAPQIYQSGSTVTDNDVSKSKDAAGKWFDDIMKMSAFMSSSDGLQSMYDAFSKQLSSGGSITEKFLNDTFKANGLNGVSQEAMETVLAAMFKEQYKRPAVYGGSIADQSIDKFLRGNIDYPMDWSQNGTQAQVLAALSGKLDKLIYIGGYGDNDNLYTDSKGEKYFQFNDDGTLTRVLDPFKTSVLSLKESIDLLQSSGKLNPLDLGFGPMRPEYFASMFTSNPNGMTSNQQVIDGVSAAIKTIDPTLSVQITNQRPLVNVGVDVKVDKQGNVTKSIIQDYGPIDSFLFKQTQRFGTKYTFGG